MHRLDPRAKIILTFLFSLVVALNKPVWVSLAALGGAVILVKVAAIPGYALLKRLVVINGFIAFLWIFLPFTYPGRALYELGPLVLSEEGVLYATNITLKSNAIALVVMAFLGTSSVFTLVHALSHMRAPDKLTHLFFFCFRYIHVILDEYNRLRDAARVRGFRPGFNTHTYKTYAYFVGMLLIRSFDRSKRIVAAMKCRGFKDQFYILHHYDMGGDDYTLSTISIIFIVSLLAASWLL